MKYSKKPCKRTRSDLESKYYKDNLFHLQDEVEDSFDYHRLKKRDEKLKTKAIEDTKHDAKHQEGVCSDLLQQIN